MRLRTPFQIPRIESVTVLLVVALSLSMPLLQYLNLTVGRYAYPQPSRSIYSSVTESMVGAAPLLFFLEGLASPLQRGNYENVTDVIAELLKRQPNLEYIFRTYLELLHDTVEAVNRIEQSLQEATILLGEGKLDDLKARIVRIRFAIDESYGKLDVLSLSVDRVEALYRVGFGAPREILRILTSRLADYEKRVYTLEEACAELDLRKPTILTIGSSDPTVWVEGTARFTGLLGCDEDPLANRTVEFMVQGRLLQETATDQDGRFIINLLISPDLGLKELVARARYLPTGDDAKIYRPSLSNTVSIHVEYYPARLNMTLPVRRIHVEERVDAEGFLTDVNGIPLGNKVVTLVVDEKILNATRTDARGVYQLSFTLHRPTSSGIHEAYALFTPTRDRYSEAASEKIQFELYYLSTRVNVTSWRSWLLSGEQLTIEGTVNLESKGTLGKQLVSAALGTREVARDQTDENGVFKVTFQVPFEMSGTEEVSLFLMPPTAWYELSATKITITIYNSATIASSSIAVVICTLLIYRSPYLRYPGFRRRRRRDETFGIKLATAKPQAPVLLQAPPTLDLMWIRGRSHNRDRVRAVYGKTRDYVAYVTGCASEPSQTHLEFLHEVKALVKDVEPRFRELTFLFEIAEYSDKQCTIEDSEKAISDAETIYQELRWRKEA